MPPVLADSLRIHIIGAGMGGMGAALALARKGYTNIHVWEATPHLGEVGAGINIPPNLARILDDWGVLGIAGEEGVVIATANVLDCSSDDILSSVQYHEYMKREYGYPFMTVHRAALQRGLVQGAQSTGVVQLHLGHLITRYDFDNCRFAATAGPPSDRKDPNSANNKVDTDLDWIQADVLLCADGVKSKAREAMMAVHGEVDEVEDTGQAAYRIMVRRSKIEEDPELVPFFEGKQSYRWIGPGRHIISYPIDSGDLFNMSTIQPDRNFVQADTWTAKGDKIEMLNTFHDFCPRVQKLLNLVPEGDVLEWKLRVHKPLPTWVEGNAALIGDACHPTLPHIAQGAAQAIEDAAALGVILSKIEKVQDVHDALLVYQMLRKPRTDWAVQTAADNTKGLLVTDKASRDAEFAASQQDKGKNPDKMISRDVHDILFHYDVAKEADRRFDELLAKVRAN